MAAIKEREDESPHIGLDLANYIETNKKTKGPEEITWDVTYFSREARKAPFPERVNPIVIRLGKFGELVKPESNLSTDIATTAVYEWARQATSVIEFALEDTSLSAQEILEELYLLGDFNPQAIMIWLSPRGKIYKETRINIYQKIGNDYLFFWSIPSSHTDKECLTFYQNLCRPEAQVIDDVEVLRIRPFAVQIPRAETMTGFLSRQISFPEVWEAIANGQAIKDTIHDYLVIKEIVYKNYYQIVRQKTEYEQRVTGAYLEIAVQERLNIELRSDAHGGLNLNALSSPDISQFLTTGRLLETTTDGIKKRKHCGKCGKHGYFTEGESCPYDKSSSN